MRTYLDCIPCFFSQALRAARIATDDEKLIKRVLEEVGSMLKEISLESTPPEIGRLIYGKVREVTGNPDPYREIKRRCTDEALGLYSYLKDEIERSDDRLLTAIRIAIAGNVIDLGVNRDFDIRREIEEALRNDFAICDYEAFREALERAGEVLYIGDNAGESVFDRLLLEQMNKPAIFVVREEPVINDVTYDDAVQAGLDQVATLFSAGTNAPGTVLETCSGEFKELLGNSDFVVAKGQGNYEGLSNEKGRIFFLLKAKCPVIANDIGVGVDGMVLKGINL